MDKEVILQGDFNLPTLNWSSVNVFDFYVSPLDSTFYDAFCNAGLTQVVREATNFPSGNIIDLVLLTNDETGCVQNSSPTK